MRTALIVVALMLASGATAAGEAPPFDYSRYGLIPLTKDGEERCGSKQQIEAELAQLGLHWSWAGLSHDHLSDGEQNWMALYLSNDNGHWAQTFSYADGKVCIVRWGDAWRTNHPGRKS